MILCLLAPSASAMQSLLDVLVCYEYGTDNDLLFNPNKSICTVFKPKAYKRFTPTVFIGDDALKFTKEAKYLGFTFNDSKLVFVLGSSRARLSTSSIIEAGVVYSSIIKQYHTNMVNCFIFHFRICILLST